MEATVYPHSVAEFQFRSTMSYADPYNEVTLDVDVRTPDGGRMRVPAFWAGDATWAVRIAGADPGEYRFQSACSNPEDTGLHGRTGVLRVEPHEPRTALERHGRVRVAADGRHFEHADGTPFFWIGDTWWMGLTRRFDWPGGFKGMAADRIQKGFSVIQIIAGPLPDMDAWDPRGRNEAGFPFAEGFRAINPAYFDLADMKIAHLVRAGLMPCIVGMWGYYLPKIGLDRVKAFWRYLIARYGAYPVAWCAAGEGTMPYYLSETREADATQQREGWTEVIRHIHDTDPYGNMVTIHPTRLGREQVTDPAVLDFEMLQTGHGGHESIIPTAQSVRESVPKEPRMPVIVAEVNYEGIFGGSQQDVQRATFYAAIFSGAIGFTYGANGIWQASTVEEPYGPSPHGRTWGNTPWQEAAQLPGGRQVARGARFLAQLPLWEMENHPDWIENPGDPDHPLATRCIGAPGRIRLVYVPRLWTPPHIIGIEQGVTYRASYFDPVKGEVIDLGVVEPSIEGGWHPPLPPEAHDWIIVMDARPA